MTQCTNPNPSNPSNPSNPISSLKYGWEAYCIERKDKIGLEGLEGIRRIRDFY
jgi:hypothetical protein